MGRINFFVLWSLREAPRQFISKSNRRCHQVQIPLPLPQQLVVFGLGEWRSNETIILVDVMVSQDVKPQRIGTLTSQTRCLIWEGGWNPELVTEAADMNRRGVYGKIILSVCGEDKANDSTLLGTSKHSTSDLQSIADVSQTLFKDSGSIQISPNSSELEDSVCYAELKANKPEYHDSTLLRKPTIRKPTVWPTDKTPCRTVIGKRGRFPWSSEDLGGLQEDTGQASIPKKRKVSRTSSEEMTVNIKKCRAAVHPSERWCHTLCQTDAETAVVIGGESSEQTHCKDSLWKLEMDNDFWFPMNPSACGTVPPCARGHSASYDPGSRSVFVYGGLREGQRFSDLYILDTLTWKWRLVTARGNVPMLAYHSAAFYKKELYVFGGVHPSHGPGGRVCSNALYIYNPEFELWYQPIVEGDRPLPRFGHSTILLSNNLIIFGGRKTATFLNDLHFLDLGFMEYTAVKSGNMPPLPRGFHAALPVSDNRMLVSGGCSSIGALQDIHVFNVETSMWSSLTSAVLCSKPRAGHSLLPLGGSGLTDAKKWKQGAYGSLRCTLLVFGGSDCAGNFYNDTVKCTLEIPVGESQVLRL
ncbi:rab9 effector protein with kelch motifs [Hypomesus transpacificus]|uniref:rab9 effector protein with kelch motifs n=1 Tax=Hypomesus transpacificus TaxID=137520 RepID=UPI001F077318|nr:rab9 effector protein with kelch motifs [Hypomesus transpacificus]